MTTITKEMTIKQVLDIDRTTAPIMMAYGMHCMGCPFSQMESLQDGCAAHGTDADELVNKLNEYLASQNA
jgi:hybrid cluster-associated redox disulfide protein